MNPVALARLLDDMADPMMWISFFAFVALAIMFVIRHEMDQEFMSKQFAYERARSKAIVRGGILCACVYILGWGLDDLSEPLIKTEIREKKVHVIRYPNFTQMMSDCLDRVNTRDRTLTDSIGICNKYIDTMKNAAVLDGTGPRATAQQQKKLDESVTQNQS